MWYPAPLGSGPLGLGQLTQVAITSGGPSLVRFITQDGDYELDPVTNQLRDTGLLQQMVTLALRTRRRSSTTDPDLGLRRRTKMGRTFEQDVEIDVRSAVAHIVTAGLATIQNVIVVREPVPLGRVFVTLVMVPRGTNEAISLGPFDLLQS